MAEGLNRVMLLGNLGKDPELRFTQGGLAILKLRIATTESYVDREGVRKERTDWHDVTVWGKRGEGLSKILHKGSSIFVEGSLKTSSYEGKDGQKRYRTEVNARNVLLTGGGGGGGGRRGPSEDRYDDHADPGGPTHDPGPAAGGGMGPDDDDIPF